MNEFGLFKHSRDAQIVQGGEVLFREGDEGDVMYAVVEGSIELSAKESSSKRLDPAGYSASLP